MKIIKNAYFYLVLLFSGMSITLFRSNEGLIVLFILGLFIFGNKLMKPSKKLIIALSIWMGYFFINTLIIKSFHPFFMVTYIVYIIIAWWLISYYKEKIFIKYENTIYYLTIISLFFYTWQIVHFNSLYSILKFLDLSQGWNSSKGYASIIIYSIREWSSSLLLPRNQGFTWEPGPFSSYVALAIFFNLARNKIIFKNKLRLVVFLIAILTTQSTTGFVLLLAIMIWIAWARFKSKYARIISIPLVLIIITLIFVNTPILQEKIISESQQDVEELIENSILYDGSYAPGRFASFQLGWIDFKNHPIAGIGGHTNSQYAKQEGASVSTINGFAMIMTRYGIIGLVLFFLLINNTGKWLAEFYSYKGYLIFPVLLLIISFGFGIIQTPIFISLWMSSLFLKKPNYIKNYVKKNTIFS